MKPGRVVIVGGGQAGVEAATALRKEGYAGNIDIYESEQSAPYQRPQLSKEFLLGGREPTPLLLRSLGALNDLGIDWHGGRSVATIDVAGRRIALSDGEDARFTDLILATGSRNRAVEVPGAGLAGIHDLRTLADARRIRADLDHARRVVVIGAGFIGLEIAAAARIRGCDVEVLDIAPRCMARVVSEGLSRYFEQAHRAEGVTLDLEEGIVEFFGATRVTAVRTSRARQIDADFVVCGVGAVPRTTLAEGARIRTDHGIVVDECLRTSAEGVWAVGDCARFPRTGVPTRFESVQNAVDQGRHVAKSIVHGVRPYEMVPWFWSKQFELKLQIAGVLGTSVDDDPITVGSPEAGRFSLLHFDAGALCCVESINQPAVHLAARRVLSGRDRVSRPAVVAAGGELRKLAAAKSVQDVATQDQSALFHH